MVINRNYPQRNFLINVIINGKLLWPFTALIVYCRMAVYLNQSLYIIITVLALLLMEMFVRVCIVYFILHFHSFHSWPLHTHTENRIM